MNITGIGSRSQCQNLRGFVFVETHIFILDEAFNWFPVWKMEL